ncbi:T9SS type A sorting domain-containing protein [Pedobacter arcticus]|uniref:T9SS type A sorting domain-containing protein n=1 Tax=Pedobacter arcticus TaxID=752140 RepID=UPI0002E7EFCC|nr:T9SS type A sorting domain-containing protein [Pedobacter arcticus]
MIHINKKIFTPLFVFYTQLCLVSLSFSQGFNPFPGTVVAQSPEPLSNSYASPSVVILADGSYLASHDITSTITAVYKSTDNGINWKMLTLVKDTHWSSLFYHDNAVYLLGVAKSFNNIVIHKSTDGGNTWTSSTNASNGLLLPGRFHTAPTPVVVHNGRVWKAFEESPDPDNERDFHSFVFSAPVGSDLLQASSWTKSTTVALNPSWFNADKTEWCEGNVVVDPNGEIVNIIRLATPQAVGGTLTMNGYATGIPRYEVAAKLNVTADGQTASFNPSTGFIHFPGAMTKFSIRYDAVSGKYWTIVNKITTVFSGWSNGSSNGPWNQRNVLMLMSSTDLLNWDEHYKVIRWNEGDIITRRENFGFQYVDWQFDGNDIVAVARTSWYGSDWHDANLITFHRLPNFRGLTMSDSPADLAPLTQPDPTILSWQFGNPATSGSEANTTSTYNDNNVQTSALTRGSGLQAMSFNRSFSSSSKTQHNSKTTAIDRNEYLQFEVQAKPGYNMDVTSIDAIFSKNTTGCKSYRWAYSKDGVNFTEIGSGEYFGMVEDADNNVQPTVRLVNYRDLQNISASQKITFRLYIWGSTSSSGRFSVGRFADGEQKPSLVVSGKVFETPALETPLVGWKFQGLTGTAANNKAAETKSSALMPAALTRGIGFTAAGLNSGYYSTTPVDTKSEALLGDDFYEFAVQPNSGQYMSLNKLNFKLRRNSAGSTIYRWTYSVDDGEFIELGTTDVPFIGTASSGYTQQPIDLSGISNLQNVSSTHRIRFRLYAWNASTTSGGFGFGLYTDDYCLGLYGTTSDQVITAWAFADPDITGQELTSNATTFSPNLQQSVLTRGNNVAGTSGSSSSFAGNFPITATKQNAIDAGNYLQFTLKANAGYKFSLSTLDARLRVQEDAPHHYSWRYSTDGVNFNDLGLADNSIVTTVNNGQAVPQINLAAYADLQNVNANKTITFRVYAWGATATTNNSFGIGKSLSGANALIIGGVVEEDDNPLPVTWGSFTGKKNEDMVTLKWATLSETSNSYFNVLRSLDGHNFTTLGKVEASQLYHYQYIDKQPAKGYNYYQLQQIDFDGKTSLSEILAIDFSFATAGFSVYSPIDEQYITVFVTSNTNTKENLRILDLSGKLLLQASVNLESGQNTIKLPLSVAKGMYLAILKNQVVKFVKF